MLYQTTALQALPYKIEIDGVASDVINNRFFPYIIFSFIVVMSSILFASTFWEKVDVARQAGWSKMFGLRRMILLALLAVYLFLIPLLGFLPASAGFIIAASVWLSPRRRHAAMVSVLLAGVMIGLIYVVFIHFLYAFLP